MKFLCIFFGFILCFSCAKNSVNTSEYIVGDWEGNYEKTKIELKVFKDLFTENSTNGMVSNSKQWRYYIGNDTLILSDNQEHRIYKISKLTKTELKFASIQNGSIGIPVHDLILFIRK